MAKYVIESGHTDKECLEALDELMKKDPELLDKFVFGCKQGVHTGWMYVDASSKSEASAMLPESLQSKARVTEASKFTPEEIKSFHKS